jgi:energy-coupling factor transporter ATP-binding protein EcfA2
MKRIQEKVKDIVEVRAYESLLDYTANPAQTLAFYHFTESTSELMAKWIDFISGVEMRSGAACALAGYRGVGKSHFLASLGAMVSQPEQRAKITDERVAASLQRLKRRHFPVSFVKRGLRETLLEEIKIALARTFEIDAANLSNSLPDLLNFAANKAGDLPFVLLVDTTYERTSRVLRDDGAMLGEIAEIGKGLNIFVGVALDDDIAGADGVNAAIARSFRIDYLDQEHLYRIVDAHIFTKQRTARRCCTTFTIIFAEVLPNFRWSEQRFSALYPLHPVILENAPFVRLYAPEFALLGFRLRGGQ